MKRAVLILTALSVALFAVASQESNWQVEFGWTSGWGNSPILKIDSSGTMSSTAGFPPKNKVCETKLQEDVLNKLQNSIKTIPDTLPLGTHIKYIDYCADEKENFIYVTIDEKKRAFSYSRDKKCWDREVPKWLLSMYEQFDHYSHTIEQCDEKAEKK